MRTTRIEGAWKAYCDTVKGRDHAVEAAYVLALGCPLPENVARAVFPELEDVPYAK